MHPRWNCLFVALLLAAVAVAQQKPAPEKPAAHAAAKASPGASLPSEQTVSAFLEQMFGYDTSLSWRVVSIKPAEAEGLAEVDVAIQGPQGAQSQKFYVTPDGRHAVIGEIMPFGAHPFDAARKELAKGINGSSHGPADAPVTLLEFSDLQCPHCKEAQPTLDRLMNEDKNVRLVFQSFPLPFHDWAEKAASYADCIARSSNDAFWKFIDSVYQSQSDITAANADEKLNSLTDQAGLKSADVAACAANPETAARVEHSVALGKSLGVNSTPTIFINGRKLGGGVPYEVLQKLVDFAAKQAKESREPPK
jgi:protein-disulfide isomerase